MADHTMDLSILYPASALALWTLLLYIVMGLMRSGAVSRREISIKFFRAYNGDEPEQLKVMSRHVINLLEMPLLFYVICIFAFITGLGGTAMLALAWTYVGVRLIHSGIHLTINNVLYRFRVFILSWAILVAMWVLWLSKAMTLN